MDAKALVSSLMLAVAAATAACAQAQQPAAAPPSYTQADNLADIADDVLDDLFSSPSQSRLDETLVQVETMSRRVPEHARLYVVAARAHILRDCAASGSGCSERAKELLLKALSLNPRLVEAHAMLAMHAMNGGCMACAKPYLSNAERLNRDHPAYLHALGRYNANTGRDAEAERNLEAALAAHTAPKKKAPVYKLLADVLAWQYKFDLAEQALRSGLEANPGALSYGTLGQFLVCSKGDYEAAVPLLQKALSLPDHGSARGNLGLAHYEKWGESYLKRPRAPATAELLKQARQAYPDLNGVFLNSLQCRGASRAAHAMLRARMVPRDILDHPIAQGFTPLAMAAKNGKTDFAKFMLSQGADPNARSMNGWTALMQAAYRGNEELVAALLKRKADPNAIHGRGNNIALFALESTASDEQTLKIVTRLQAAKADFSYAPQPHVNAVYTAVIRRKPKTLTFLLSKGLRGPAVPPGDGLDVMNAAIFFGGPAVVQALIDGGIPLDPPGLAIPYDRFAESYGKKDIAEQIRRARGVKG